MQAAARGMMKEKPSLEMRVTWVVDMLWEMCRRGWVVWEGRGCLRRGRKVFGWTTRVGLVRGARVCVVVGQGGQKTDLWMKWRSKMTVLVL